jgi:hypothetical protein
LNQVKSYFQITGADYDERMVKTRKLSFPQGLTTTRFKQRGQFGIFASIQKADNLGKNLLIN